MVCGGIVNGSVGCWECDHLVHGDAVFGVDGSGVEDGVGISAGGVDDGVEVGERDSVYVHGDGHERGGYRSCVGCVGCGDSVGRDVSGMFAMGFVGDAGQSECR